MMLKFIFLQMMQGYIIIFSVYLMQKYYSQKMINSQTGLTDS